MDEDHTVSLPAWCSQRATAAWQAINTQPSWVVKATVVAFVLVIGVPVFLLLLLAFFIAAVLFSALWCVNQVISGFKGLLPEKINLKGRFHIVNDFAFPDAGPLTMGPDMLHGFMRRNMVQKPVVDNKACKLCGECWKYCPAKAITHNIKGIRFNYDTCIRCYCCLEICPHGVIRMHEPLLGKLIRPYLDS